MITVRELQLILDRVIHTGQLKLDSEVRFISSNNTDALMDCSLADKYTTIPPGNYSGVDKQGVPRDRRYGDGVLLLTQESVMRPAPKQILKQVDFSF